MTLRKEYVFQHSTPWGEVEDFLKQVHDGWYKGLDLDSPEFRERHDLLLM